MSVNDQATQTLTITDRPCQAFSLGLGERMIVVPSSAPSAKNRFIWFGGQLNKLPSSLPAFLVAALRLPVIRSLIPSALFGGLLREPFRPSQFLRPKSESKAEVQRQRSREYLLDESIESFIRRRFGDAFGGRLASNVLSAVIHGIYAADTRKLSVRSTLPFLWNTEQKHGSLLRALLPPKWNKRYRVPTEEQMNAARDEQDEMDRSRRMVAERGGSDLLQRLDKASVFSFKNGIGEITSAMASEIAGYPNVTVRMGEWCENITPVSEGLRVCTSSGDILSASHVISALPSSTLRETLGDSASTTSASILTHNPSTNVSVVNIVIPSSAAGGAARPSRPINVEEGFGFLIPRAENNSNPDGILGVVFDSDAIPGQDEPSEEAITKLTVMIGGPYYASEKAVPDEAEVKERALRALEKHLSLSRSITEHPHTLIQIKTQRNCISTYLPGHYSRMRTLHELLSNGQVLNGRLSVTGASYVGVSLNDIVRHSVKLAEQIASAEKQQDIPPTGLESFRL